MFYTVLLLCLDIEPHRDLVSSKMGTSCVYLCNDGSVISLAFLCIKLINLLDTIYCSKAFVICFSPTVKYIFNYV